MPEDMIDSECTEGGQLSSFQKRFPNCMRTHRTQTPQNSIDMESFFRLKGCRPPWYCQQHLDLRDRKHPHSHSVGRNEVVPEVV
eukprot:s2072_g10.t1